MVELLKEAYVLSLEALIISIWLDSPDELSLHQKTGKSKSPDEVARVGLTKLGLKTKY